MEPIDLYIKDFCSHSETKFSFNDFNSSLIVGKIKGNDRFSNAAGKSTIFNAIEYVFYNEIQFSTLNKIIRKGCDSCLVEISFRSGVDNEIYKISRSLSKKSGSDVSLYRRVEDKWENLTQRRSSDTEKEIEKVIGFNYKVFCASCLFVQPNAENNVQKDYGNLPNLTVEKRKNVLKELLQLNIYSQYEKIAKNKLAEINSEIERAQVKISSLGNPQEAIKQINFEIQEDEKILNSLKESQSSLQSIINSLSEDISKIKSEISNSEFLIKDINSNLEKCTKDIAQKQTKISDLQLSVKNLPIEGKKISLSISNAKDKLQSLQKEKESIIFSEKDLDNIQNEIYSISTNILSLKKDISLKSNPLPKDSVCPSCHQELTEDHRHSWNEKNKKELDFIYKNLSTQENLLKDKQLVKNSIIDNDKKIKSLDNDIKEMQNSILLLSKDLEIKRSDYKSYGNIIGELEKDCKELEGKREELNDKLSEILKSNIDEKIRLKSLKEQEYKNFSDKFSILNEKISALLQKRAVMEHKLEVQIKNNETLIILNKKLNDLNSSIFIRTKVVDGFSSTGIPALIINSILDELQSKSNQWLTKLHPGIQLQFVVSKENKKSKIEDTLDIIYYIAGEEMEYKQLSGAQKILVSLAIKLSLMHILNYKLGIKIKLMLLDEVDQPLDQGTAEIFADAIKILHKDMKILAITHNPDLKHKFSHAIVVEQDENGVSSGSLINW